MAALAGLRYHADQHIVIFHPLVLAGTSPLVHQTDLAGRNADIEINIIAADQTVPLRHRCRKGTGIVFKSIVDLRTDIVHIAGIGEPFLHINVLFAVIDAGVALR